MIAKNLERLAKTEPTRLDRAIAAGDRVTDEAFQRHSAEGSDFEEACRLAAEDGDLAFHIELGRM